MERTNEEIRTVIPSAFMSDDGRVVPINSLSDDPVAARIFTIPLYMSVKPKYENVLQAVARGWCHVDRKMDASLAEAIATEICLLFEVESA